MWIRWLLIMTMFTVAPALWPGGWAPIPAEVWALKEDPAKGIKGAVILEQRLILRRFQIEQLVRIRVLSESGRAAADLADFGEAAHSFEGRTIYPDGQEVRFNQRKDFKSRTVASVGNSDIKRTLMVPPGVTPNCVVEVRWLESADREAASPLPKRLGRAAEWMLGGEWAIQCAAVEILTSFPWAYTLYPGPVHSPTVKEAGGYKVFTFTSLPAYQEAPYSLQVNRPIPRLAVYYQPERLFSYSRTTPQEYWDAVARLLLKSWYVEDVRTGGPFKALAQELTTGLVGGPQAEAREILRRLDSRIKNRRRLTHQAAAAVGKAPDYPEDENLGATVKMGSASSSGMGLLLFHLLKTHGIQPKLGLVADRDVRVVTAGGKNPFQFTHHLIGVDEPGRSTLWLDSSLRFAPPGTMHPDYQGTLMMVVDTQAWTTKFETLPPPPARENRRSYQFRVQMGDGEDAFTMDASYAGYPEYAERYRFIPLEAKEQERLLKEELEGWMKGATFSQVRVLNAQDPTQPLALHVEGRIEREEGRRREVYPFPGMAAPLYQPSAWPEVRQDLIVLPYLRTHRAVSRIQVPKGYQIPAYPRFHQTNTFGTVTWEVRALETPGELEVVLDVVVSAFAARPGAYQELKAFLGWVADANSRTLVLGGS